MKRTMLKKYFVLAILILLGSCSFTRYYHDGVYSGKIKSTSPLGWSPELTIVIKNQNLIAVNFDYQADPKVYPNSQEIKKQVRDLGKVNPELIYYTLIKQLLDKQTVEIKDPPGATRIAGHFKRLAEVLLAKAQRGETNHVVLEEQMLPGVKTNSKNHTPSTARPEQDKYGPIAVVSSHQLATKAGMEVLETGGTAADAAFAVAAVLTIVEPWFSSILGGGTWALYYDQATKRVYALDGFGTVGSKAKAELFTQENYGESPGMRQAVVPGAWAGWMIWLKRFGTRSLTELLKPALAYAEGGVAVSAEFVRRLKQEEAVIRRWPNAALVYLPHGKVPCEGDILCQKQMADTFRELLRIYETACIYGEKEAFDTVTDYFYRGPLAEKIVRFMERKGGLLTVPDFNNFYTSFVEPLSLDYKGIQVYHNPSNNPAYAMLIGLNILKGFDFSGWKVDSSDTIHLLAEVAKLAYVDNSYDISDPKLAEVTAARLLSDTCAAEQRARICPDKALAWPVSNSLEQEKHRTGEEYATTFSIVDRYGNAAAVTTSLGASFLVIGDTGIVINNWLQFMDFDKNNVHAIVPGKKVGQMSYPYLALYKGKPYLLGGNTGSDSQSQAQMQQFIYVVEFGLTPQEAVSRPRFIAQISPVSSRPRKTANALVLEDGILQTVRNELYKRGQTIVTGHAFGSANMLVIKFDTGEILTGSDPRCSTGLGMVK